MKIKFISTKTFFLSVITLENWKAFLFEMVGLSLFFLAFPSLFALELHFWKNSFKPEAEQGLECPKLAF